MKQIFLFMFAFSTLFASYNSIEFTGNKSFSDATLKAVLGVDSEGLKFWKSVTQIEEADLDEMDEKLTDFYHSKGFYKVNIDKNGSGKRLQYIIDELQAVRVADFSIKSAVDVSRLVAIKLGDVFETQKFTNAKEAIRRFLDENGYPKATLNASAIIDMDVYEAKVSFEIENLSPSDFAGINIQPLPNLSRDAILQKLEFKSGQKYDVRKVEQSYQNLYMTDLFTGLSVHPNLQNQGSDVDVDINASVGALRSYKIAMGYDTDEGVRAKFSWQHRNFFGDFRRLETYAQFAVLRQNAGVKLYFPQLYDFSVENVTLFEKSKYDSYSEERLSNVVKAGFNIKDTKHKVGFNVESGHVTAERPSSYIKNQTYFVDSFLYEYELDHRDSKLDARSGHLIVWNMELTDQYLGSTLNYMKTNLEVHKIVSFDESSVFRDLLFAGRANIGVIDDYKTNDIPIFKRFFAGGSFSNRGYGYRKLGSKDEYGNYIGGNTLLDMSFESRYRVTNKFWAVAFYDDTLLSRPSFVFGGEHKRSFGIGGRYHTVVGPIRVDIGMPMNDEKKRPVLNISFGQVF